MLILYHVFVVGIFCWKPFHPEVPSVCNSFAKRSGANVRFEHMTVLILHQWNRKYSLITWEMGPDWRSGVEKSGRLEWIHESLNQLTHLIFGATCIAVFLSVCWLIFFKVYFSKFISVCSLTWKITDTVETDLLEKNVGLFVP